MLPFVAGAPVSSRFRDKVILYLLLYWNSLPMSSVPKPFTVIINSLTSGTTAGTPAGPEFHPHSLTHNLPTHPSTHPSVHPSTHHPSFADKTLCCHVGRTWRGLAAAWGLVALGGNRC